MSFKSLIFKLLIFGIYFSSYSVGPNITVFERQNHFVICVPTVHIDISDNGIVGRWQRKKLIKFAVKSNAHLIGEVLSDYQGNNPHIKKCIDDWAMSINQSEIGMPSLSYDQLRTRIDLHFNSANYQIHEVDGLLRNLIKDCKDNGISYYNADCRQPTEASKNLETVTGKDVAKEYIDDEKEVEDDIEKIKNEDSDEARIIYEVCAEKLKELKNLSKKYMEFLENCPYHLGFLKQDVSNVADNFAEYFDVTLIDLRAIVNWNKNKDTKVIIICLGGRHIHNFAYLFRRLGYTSIEFGMPLQDMLNATRESVLQNFLNFEEVLNSLELTKPCVLCRELQKNSDDFDKHVETCLKVKTKFNFLDNEHYPLILHEAQLQNALSVLTQLQKEKENEIESSRIEYQRMTDNFNEIKNQIVGTEQEIKKLQQEQANLIEKKKVFATSQMINGNAITEQTDKIEGELKSNEEQLQELHKLLNDQSSNKAQISKRAEQYRNTYNALKLDLEKFKEKQQIIENQLKQVHELINQQNSKNQQELKEKREQDEPLITPSASQSSQSSQSNNDSTFPKPQVPDKIKSHVVNIPNKEDKEKQKALSLRTRRKKIVTFSALALGVGVVVFAMVKWLGKNKSDVQAISNKN